MSLQGDVLLIFIDFLAPFQSGSDVKLHPGNYNFPFQFPLPVSPLPTSFEGAYGSVRYWLDAVVDRPWRIDLNTRTPLVIVERVQIRKPQFLVSTDSKCIPCPSKNSSKYGSSGNYHNLSFHIKENPEKITIP